MMIRIIRAGGRSMKSLSLFNKEKVLLFVILILGTILRLYGLNWDQGFHLHPDERAIVMFTIPLQFPKSLDEFLSPSSPLNPHFFAYGNFPLYLLKAVASFLSNFEPSYLSYDRINLIGRSISAMADIGTIFLIFLLAKKIINRTTGLLASFFYAISVFPIQASHFYAVDTLLTFFILFTLYQLIRFYEKPLLKNAILVGVCFGLSLVTKISAIPLIIAVFAAITADFVLIFIKKPHKPHVWLPHVPRFLKRLIFDGVIIAFTTGIMFVILQPYAIIDFQEFLKQNLLQSEMTHNAFVFPYTLQYVGKIPYWYEIKNVYLWGLGPILGSLSFLGILYISFKVSVEHYSSSEERSDESRRSIVSSSRQARTIIILIFFFAYFLIVGKFAVGWMRYMLPLYPLFALFAAIFALKLHILVKRKLKMPKRLFVILNSLFIILISVWTLSFMNIYTKSNTRVLASEWIYKNIPENKILAIEHWDDGMPIGGNIIYKTLELPIYGMSDPSTENEIYQKVQESDYIIIASNRLYVPLQKISKNCQEWNLPQERCSHNANRYYEKLFNGDLGFKKVAEFAIYPTIPIINIPINDQNADESFTVYDHPKVMIFKK